MSGRRTVCHRCGASPAPVRYGMRIGDGVTTTESVFRRCRPCAALLAEALAERTDEPLRPELAVECPACEAPVACRCIGPGHVLDEPHPERVDRFRSVGH